MKIYASLHILGVSLMGAIWAEALPSWYEMEREAMVFEANNLRFDRNSEVWLRGEEERKLNDTIVSMKNELQKNHGFLGTFMFSDIKDK
jgi:hypothetical protein